MANTPPYGQPQNGQPQYNQPPQLQAPNYSQPQPGGPQYGQPQPMPYGQPQQYGQSQPYGQPQPPMPQYGQPRPMPYGQPAMPQPTASQPAVPQPAMPQYAQSQQYGQPQPPMPGNFPSQQAGAAAKNKPPVAIIIGAVAAVVVIALAAVFSLTNRVSRSDHEEALVQTQALESSYTAINEEFSSAASATDNDSSSAYDEGKKKLKTFKQDSDKLAAMKAVKKDKDVKEKYETFEQDRAKYERYMNDLAQTMPALMKMTHTCTKLPKFDSADMSSYYRDLSKALESCAADAGDLAKVPIKSYAEYGADMQESVSKKKDIVDQMADLNLNDIEYGSADYEKLQDLHSKMSDIDSPTLDQSDLQKAAKEADLSGSLKDLETTLSEKIK